jgi:hypothetical protein
LATSYPGELLTRQLDRFCFLRQVLASLLDRGWNRAVHIHLPALSSRSQSVENRSRRLTTHYLVQLRRGHAIAPPAPLLATSIYDVRPRNESLERCVDFEKLNGARTVCIVTATDIETGQHG